MCALSVLPMVCVFMFGRHNRNKFQVVVKLHSLTDVPYVNAVMFAKLRIVNSRHSSQYSSRVAIENNRVLWDTEHRFTCRFKVNTQTKVLEPRILKVSIRMETKGGKSFHKVGFVSVNLACFAAVGDVICGRRYILEGYDSGKRKRQDNSLLLLNFSLCQVQGDTCFRVPAEDLAKCLVEPRLPLSSPALLLLDEAIGRAPDAAVTEVVSEEGQVESSGGSGSVAPASKFTCAQLRASSHCHSTQLDVFQPGGSCSSLLPESLLLRLTNLQPLSKMPACPTAAVGGTNNAGDSNTVSCCASCNQSNTADNIAATSDEAGTVTIAAGGGGSTAAGHNPESSSSPASDRRFEKGTEIPTSSGTDCQSDRGVPCAAAPSPKASPPPPPPQQQQQREQHLVNQPSGRSPQLGQQQQPFSLASMSCDSTTTSTTGSSSTGTSTPGDDPNDPLPLSVAATRTTTATAFYANQSLPNYSAKHQSRAIPGKGQPNASEYFATDSGLLMPSRRRQLRFPLPALSKQAANTGSLAPTGQQQTSAAAVVVDAVTSPSSGYLSHSRQSSDESHGVPAIAATAAAANTVTASSVAVPTSNPLDKSA